jgi:hypothetical protein
MKKRKVSIKENNFWDIEIIKMSGDFSGYYLEECIDSTNDLGETVSMLMKFNNINEEIWNIEIGEIDTWEITPSNSLYWLSGGDIEWLGGDNYTKNWSDVYLEFQERFGDDVINIIKESKTLGDIKKGFLNRLNLPTLYEFAIEIGVVEI